MYKKLKDIPIKMEKMYINKISRLYQPFESIPKGAELKKTISKSHRLMLELGMIKHSSPGCFHLLPLAVRSIEKLNRLVDNEMRKLGAQKLETALLINERSWKKSGRLDKCNELFKFADRHNTNYLLGPTHEETLSELLSESSYKQFPIRLYQIGPKFRDEIKPRLGLIRGRQFLMKDMYTFDVDEHRAMKTYEEVNEAYGSIFRKLGVDFCRVKGPNGIMGGDISHEYHYRTDVGEDTLIDCNNCRNSYNSELAIDDKCPGCGSDDLRAGKGIEVGHTFYLGTKYSKIFNTNYISAENKKENLKMGCYGLGLTRILAAGIEVLSEEHEIRWPLNLSPYSVIIIPPKAGSREEIRKELTMELYANLDKGLENDVIVDDRINLSIGKRVMEAKRVGYPLIVVLGHRIKEDPPLFEINDLINENKLHLCLNDSIDYLLDNKR